MIDIKDEILTGEPRYRLRDGNGNILQDNISIEQITPATQEGTPINKALLEAIQVEMLNDSKQVIIDYTFEEDTDELTITDLDMVADGGFYDFAITGALTSNSISAIRLQINGITSESYYHHDGLSESSSNTTGNAMWIGNERAGGITIATIGIFNGYVYLQSLGMYSSTALSTRQYNNRVKADNVTEMTFLGSIKAGTRIKVSKRR